LRRALEKAGIADFTKSTAEVGRALDQVLEEDPDLRRDVERDLEIRKALQNPLLDYRGFGGRRDGAPLTAVPLSQAHASEADAERAAAALGIATEKLLATSKSSVAAARGDRDFRRGTGLPLAKRRTTTADQMAAELEELAALLARGGDE